MTQPDRWRARPRVVVVAATTTRGDRLRAVLEAAPAAAEVVGVLRGPDGVVGEVARHEPDVVVVDLADPRSGLAAVELVMAAAPTPVVCAAGGLAADTAPVTDAYAAGAVDVVVAACASDLPWEQRLRSGVTGAAGARVIRHPRAHLPSQAGPAARTAEEHAAAAVPGVVPAVPGVPSVAAPGMLLLPRLVAIGASTGGPPALAAILAVLPGDFAVPVLVVQHMAEGFILGLAQWLDSGTDLRVVVAVEGRRLRAGEVAVAPSGRNVTVAPGLVVELHDTLPGQFHVPSIDVALDSVAAVCRSRAVGVLLTGMGRDGARGLGAMHAAGALTYAQDEATSAVFGMPRAAQAAGAAAALLALPDVAPAIVAACTVPDPVVGVPC